MLDPSIILAVKPPEQPNFLAQAADLQKIRSSQIQDSLRQQQAQMDQGKYQREVQQNQEADRAQAAQQLTGQLIAQNTAPDPTTGQLQTNHQAVIQGLAAAGHGKEAVAYDVQRRADEKTAIQNQKDQIATQKSQLDLISQGLSAASQAPDDQLQQSIDQQRDRLQAAGVNVSQVPTGMQMMQAAGGDVNVVRNQLAQHQQAAMTADQQVTAHQKDLDYALKLNEFQHKLLTDAPTTDKELTNNTSQLLKDAQNQDQWNAALQHVPARIAMQFGQQYSPEAAARAAQMGMTAAEAAKAQQDAKPIPGRDVPFPAAVMNQKIQEKQAEDSAAITKSMQMEVAKARLAGGIGQIIDPQQRNEASRALDAADKTAVDSIGDAARLKNTIQQSLGGNKVSPNVETIETLRAILPRINGQELKSVGGAGNAYDRAAGFLGKWTAGQPIPDNIQKDFMAIADGQQQLAEQKHKVAYDVVGQRFGVKGLNPPDVGAAYAKNAPSSSGGSSSTSFSVKDPNGKTHAFKSQADADAFKKAAGIS